MSKTSFDLDLILDQALDDFEADQLNAKAAEAQDPNHQARSNFDLFFPFHDSSL